MLPSLTLADWRPTKDTLHLYCQVLGKLRLATTPPLNHWWNVPLYVDVRGLTTRRLHHGAVTFDLTLDVLEPALIARTGDGRIAAFPIHDGLSVAAFRANVRSLLGGLGIEIEIDEKPFGVPMTTPFDQDTEHASWDAEHVRRFLAVLDWSDGVLAEFSGWFSGKASPVHLFWHSFDLAISRFSGRAAPPLDADHVTVEAYSSEVIAFGFWAGDDKQPDAAYYSYTAPEPDGLREQPLASGAWADSGSGSLAILPYETVRRSADPRQTLLAFLESAYQAGARTAGWDTAGLTSAWCPSPDRLRALHATASDALGRPDPAG